MRRLLTPSTYQLQTESASVSHQLELKRRLGGGGWRGAAMATKARIFFSKGRVKFDQAHVVKNVGAPSRAAAPTLDLRLIHKLITHRVRAAAGRGFRGSRRSGGYKLGHWG